MQLTNKLTAIADSIRAKLQTSSLMTLDQMPTNIDNIGGHAIEDALLTHTLTGTYINPRIELIEAYALYSNTDLTAIGLDQVTRIAGNVFYNCTSLEAVHAPVCTAMFSQCFRNCSSLVALILDNIDTVPQITNLNIFQGTPIESGTGYIYVPNDLVDTIKNSTAFSGIASQIKGASEIPQTYKDLFGIE